MLTPGQSLTLGGDVRTVRLAGGPTPSDAASIYTGRGRLALRGVTVGSFDPGTGPALPAGPGRPFLAVARGGRFEAIDSAINDLGTVPTDPAPRAGLGLGETSTGSLVRTTLARNSIGLKLDRTDRVRLEGVTVSDSAADGLVLRGDRGTALTGITVRGNGGNGVLVTGPSSDRPITGISASGNKLFGVALLGQTTPQITAISHRAQPVGGVRVSWSTNTTISDLTSTDDAIGVYTHVGSAQITINRATITGARRGLHIEKTTRDLTAKRQHHHRRLGRRHRHRRPPDHPEPGRGRRLRVRPAGGTRRRRSHRHRAGRDRRKRRASSRCRRPRTSCCATWPPTGSRAPPSAPSAPA